MSPQPLVTVIAPKKALANADTATPTKKRVAAYARVSTDNEEQLTSYEAQVKYYTQHIQENPNWVFVEVYADEGISATSTKYRDGFNRMITDALSGKIDLILTKSISRFARNTVDALVNVRKLRDKNVEVYFEKENIYTFDTKGEFMLTLLSGLAQEESRSISLNVKWGLQKRFADGKVSLPYKQFLGYEKGDNDLPKIIEEQAKIVKYIYRLFLEGFSPTKIARRLTSEGIPSPSGKKGWQASTVDNILKNEKYKGDALLGKRVTIDFLSKRQKKNEGEGPQFYVRGSHPAIVSSEVFDMVQHEFEKRKQKGYTSRVTHFSNRIVCSECGGVFGSKVWHSTTKYRRTVWQCNHKFSNGERCKTPHLYETEIQDIFVTAFNRHLQNKDEILSAYTEIIEQLTDTRPLEQEHAQVDREMTELETLFESLVQRNANTLLDQNEYKRCHDEYFEKFQRLKVRQAEISARIGQIKAKHGRINAYLSIMANQDAFLTEFDEDLFVAAVDRITITADGQATVRFQDESTIDCGLQQRKRA